MTRLRIRRKNESQYFSLHTHSKYSVNDALSSVEEIVSKAKALGYKGLGLTDHGNMAGSVELYRECKKAGIKPFPGSEFYLVKDRGDKNAKRYHVCILAYTTQGYRNLIRLSTQSHRNFYYKPLIDLADLAELSESGGLDGLTLTTGCYFGLVVQTLVNDGYQAAKQVVATFASWIDTRVEIQRHNIEQEPMSEDEIAESLLRIADELNLPIVITQDSHYTELDQEEIHSSLKTLIAWGPDVDDAVFPGDGFHMVDDQWMIDRHGQEVFDRAVSDMNDLLAKHDMYIEEIENYHYRVPTVLPDPDSYVKRRASKALIKRGLIRSKGGAYRDQLAEELGVISFARMSDYMAMVADVCDHMRDVKMFYQCRGSAAGSLVCWLLGITNVDPLKWKLRFDRFLSKDRTKPPDIDIDIEHDRRQELIDWIGTKYTVLQIGTYGTYSIEGDDEEEHTGSLRVKYLSRQRKATGKADWSKVTPEELRELEALSDLGLTSGYGKHAAGLIMCGSKEELESQVPMMWIANSQTMVSQYNGPTIESIGLVKLDVLGVKTLSVLRRTLLNLDKDPKDGLDFIPLDDRSTFRQIASGETGGMFQLEGGTSRKNISKLKPSKIGDVIAAMALFRPGVMNSGATDSYLARKAKREKVAKRHRLIEAATKETFGILLYQDQVIEILRSLGMGADDLTAFLKAVKASNKNVGHAEEVINHYSPIVQQMCHDAGMDDEDVKWLWDAFEAFANYSFNRAHSTVYGLTAYYTAYLIVHHPLEFHAALLAVAASTDKERWYMSVTRGRGIRLLRPDVNGSGATYSVDPKGRGILKGLVSLKGLGYKAANEIMAHQPYEDIDDFVARVNPSTVTGIKPYLKSGDLTVGILGILHDADALKSLGVVS